MTRYAILLYCSLCAALAGCADTLPQPNMHRLVPVNTAWPPQVPAPAASVAVEPTAEQGASHGS